MITFQLHLKKDDPLTLPALKRAIASLPYAISMDSFQTSDMDIATVRTTSAQHIFHLGMAYAVQLAEAGAAEQPTKG